MRTETIQSVLIGAGFLLAGAAWGQVPAPTETVILTAAPPYSATGELYILKADTNAPSLHNPVLVVEGFDIDNSMNWPELYDLLNQENLVGDMQAFGRDLLVLNFTDSTIDILANAALNETAIAYINAHRANPNDKFTVVGASLGGLTTRKALVDMPNPDVDTWISFDAPHEGANIPLGLQEFFEYYASVNSSITTFDPIREFLAALDRMAARQLLIVHHSHSPDAPAGSSAPERQDFVNTMDATGYPTNCKTIAIANGSGFGNKLPFNPGDLIIHWTYSGGGFIDPNIYADIFALPFSTNSASPVFHGEFEVFLFGKSPETVSSYFPLSLDNAPGGMRASFYQLFTNLPPSYINGDDYCAQTNHCFVPTVSALGIPIDNLESNLAANAALTAMSPFDEIHYAIDNEEHVEINARNKRWIVRALLEDIDTDGDGLDDYGEYLIGTDYDSAASSLQVVQTIISTNGGVQVSWNAYPNTQYDVWFTDGLTNAWSLIETIPPTTDPALMREYTTDPAGFFQVSADPVDPVTD